MLLNLMSQDLVETMRPLFTRRIRRSAQYLVREAGVIVTDVGAAMIRARMPRATCDAIRFEAGLEDGGWSSSCYCDAHRRGGNCQHVWAAVLLADRDSPDIFQPWLHRGSRGPREAQRRGSHALSAVPDPKPKWKEGLELLERQRPEERLEDPWPRVARTDWVLRYVLDLDQLVVGDQFGLVAEERRRKSNGDWTAWKLRRGGHEEALARAGAEDAALLGRLALADLYGGGYYRQQPFGPFRLSLEDGVELLPELCASGRLWSRTMATVDGTTLERGPLSWQEGEAWRPAFALTRDAQGDLELVARLVRAGEIMPIEEPELILDSGLLVLGQSLSAYDPQGAAGLVALSWGGGEFRVPAGEETALLEELAWHVGEAELTSEVDGLLATGEPQPHLEVVPSHGGRRVALACRIGFRYGQAPRVSPEERRRFILDESSGLLLRRDRAAETAALETFLRLDGRHSQGDRSETRHGSVTDKALPGLVQGLVREGWSVEAEGLRYRRHVGSSMSVSSGIDWFDLDCEARFDDQVAHLPQLLAAVREGRDMVVLSDGSMGLLPAEWLRQVATLGALAEEKDGKLRFRKSQAAVLDALLAMQSEVDVDERFDEMRRQLAGFTGVEPKHEPDSFRGELRPYQREGLGWLEFLREQGFGGCLADDMGLGKTVQVLAMLESLRLEDEESRPSLLVVPRSLIFNWISEAARFTPRLRVLDYSGAQRKRLTDDIAECDLVLTTYGTVRLDVTELREIAFRYVILDESQAIKNARSQAAKAVRLLQAQHRLALTGTPIENHLGELWSLFEFLNPGMLGRSAAFQQLTSARLEADLGQERRALLGTALRPFLLRRTKEQVLPELPAKTEQVLHCELEGRQRKDYDRVKARFRAELLGAETDELSGSKLGLLEALLRLRQLACHPGLLDAGRRDQLGAKLETLLPMLAELISEGHSALVFSQFTSFLSILREKLDADGIRYEYLDGKTRKREERVERFQEDPDCPLFLISLKAGGVGLNLTKADYVFILDPWWNPATESQAIDRTHRIGQTKKVTAYRLIARDTIEEQVLKLQASKRELADAVLGVGDGSLLRDLTREDLERLLA